jgi:hypothetical protein
MNYLDAPRILFAVFERSYRGPMPTSACAARLFAVHVVALAVDEIVPRSTFE